MRFAHGLASGLVMGVLTAAVGCSRGEAQQPQPAGPPPAVPVATAAAVRKDVPLEMGVIGTVEAYSTVTVRAQITGELTTVKFQQGDDVEAGQELFTLDRRPLEAALQQAEANLAARYRPGRQRPGDRPSATRQLVERGILAREQRDTARATVAALEGTLAADRAAVENAKVQLQYATIRAPIQGRTGALMVTAGNLVRANDQTPLVTINQVSPIFVSFAFPEASLSALRRYLDRGSLRVEARPTGGEGPAAVGTITFVDNAVDQTTGTIKIKGTFANENRALWPGQFVNVVVRLATESAAIVVPTVAVQTGPEGSYVYVVKPDQTVEMRAVTVARVAGTESMIASGLDAGDTVVTDGHLRLVPGGRVTPARGRRGKGGIMNVAELFIKRPITTTLIMLGITVFGVMSYRLLPVSDLPTVDFPTIQVQASLPGASPETMASAVALPLEKQFATIAGLDSVNSTSTQGSTNITLQFSLNRNIDAAAQDVQAMIARAARQLPPQMPSPPSYQKVNPGDQPVIFLSLRSATLPLSTVNEYAETIGQRISMVSGVAQVQLFGAAKYAVRVDVDPRQLSARGIGIDEVASRDSERQRQPADRDDVRARPRLHGARQRAADAGGGLRAGRHRLPQRQSGAAVSEVARVYDGIEQDKSANFYQGLRNINLSIQKQPGTNVVAVVDAIRTLLPTFREQLPPSVLLDVRTDRSASIRESVHDVKLTLVLTFVLVVMVIFVFLRSVTATIISSLTLPVTMVATFAVMYLFNYSLDNLSLMALTLSVGFVVDNTIVMLENIVRHMEMGKTPMRASFDGSKEVAFTIVAMTVSLVAIFIPVLFMGGLVGRLLEEFAVTIGVAIIVSGFVSISLTPMLCSRFLKPPQTSAMARSTT